MSLGCGLKFVEKRGVVITPPLFLRFYFESTHFFSFTDAIMYSVPKTTVSNACKLSNKKSDRKCITPQHTISEQAILLAIIKAILLDPNQKIFGVHALLYMQNDLTSSDWNKISQQHLTLYTKSLFALKQQCNVFNLFPHMTVTYEDDKFFFSESSLGFCEFIRVTFRMNSKKLLVLKVYSEDKKKVMMQKFYNANCFWLNKLCQGICNINGIYDIIESPNIIQHILDEYKNGYISVMRPLTDFSLIKERLQSNWIMYQHGKTPIHSEIFGTWGKITIGTTLAAIKELYPEFYKDRIEGGKCPLSQRDYSDMQNEFVILTNTGFVLDRKYGMQWLENNDTCPVLRQQLY